MMTNYVKARSFFFILVLFFSTDATCQSRLPPRPSQKAEVVNWASITAAYDRYIDFPSSENAQFLLASMPADRPSEEIGDANQALRHIFSADNLPVLYEEANAGDKSAIEVYFRLLFISDGFYNEMVLGTLGGILRNLPERFLEILKEYQDTRYVRTNGNPVSFVGSGLNVHRRAAILMLEKRISALESVRNPKYKNLVEACVRELRVALKLRGKIEED